MSAFLIQNARVYRTEYRDFIPGAVVIEDGKIKEILTDPAAVIDGMETVDAKEQYLVPGLVDAHTHGRIGYDFDSATAEQMKAMRASYAADGTTTVFPTIASAPLSQIETAIDNVKAAGFDGIHLEGRYLNCKRRGAHREDLLFPLDVAELSSLLDRMEPLNVHISCAAELEGGEAFVKTAIARGATVSIGHTDATYEQALDAMSWGVNAFTHTFNAMRPIHHREPGPVVAGLTTENAYCEVIADGFHLNPAIVKLAYMAKKPAHLTLITDSMSATKCEDGEYSIAGEKVYVVNGKAINEEGNISGSTICLYQAVRNLMTFAGVSFAEALPYATIVPASMLKIEKSVGSIAAGKDADLLLVCPETYDITAVWQKGEAVAHV
ncbi:MAG: N-acetylglucosamine-6-phosphate deacetylase [Clostridia bacterium]|nr:N-acetylglucosamine-6-phosphate deacetylase [Clostridia bacterium]